MAIEKITQEQLKEHLSYDPIEGVFRWRKNKSKGRTWNTRFAGKVAGTNSPHGYVIVSISGNKLRAHRLAFLYMTGRLPSECVDHINGDSFDNRWKNLREATYQENNQNQALKAGNKTGVPGVRFKKEKGKWAASIKHKYRLIFLGYFDDFEDAVEARRKAEGDYGFHKNHGRERIDNTSWGRKAA